MDENLKNFRSWYVSVLETLYPILDAGIAALLISFPLLERYLRQKSGLTPANNLDPKCWRTLLAVFPELRDAVSAERFWQVFRNGFLHQVTLSHSTRKGTSLPNGSLTHDVSEPVSIASDDSFVVHPRLFSQRVVSTIEIDFAIFAGVGQPVPQFLHVVAYVSPTQEIVLSTRGS